jgi:hypothetical protein
VSGLYVRSRPGLLYLGQPLPYRLSSTLVARKRTADFKAHDRNGDGKLSKAEYAVLLTAIGNGDRLDNFFAQLDADGDGLVTPKEFETETQ